MFMKSRCLSLCLDGTPRSVCLGESPHYPIDHFGRGLCTRVPTDCHGASWTYDFRPRRVPHPDPLEMTSKLFLRVSFFLLSFFGGTRTNFVPGFL